MVPNCQLAFGSSQRARCSAGAWSLEQCDDGPPRMGLPNAFPSFKPQLEPLLTLPTPSQMLFHRRGPWQCWRQLRIRACLHVRHNVVSLRWPQVRRPLCGQAMQASPCLARRILVGPPGITQGCGRSCPQPDGTCGLRPTPGPLHPVASILCVNILGCGSCGRVTLGQSIRHQQARQAKPVRAANPGL